MVVFYWFDWTLAMRICSFEKCAEPVVSYQKISGAKS
jgi:hypothetical protein